MYGVPKSTLYDVMKSSKIQSKRNGKKINAISSDYKFDREEETWIKKNVIPPQLPLTIAKLNKEMSEIFPVKNRKRDIKRFLKQEMKFSYKRGGSKIINGVSERNKLQQSLFSSRILSKILNTKLLINIDEASF